MILKYFFNSLIAIPALPLMIYQGKRIRASVPELPPAKGPEGLVKHSVSEKEALQIITIGESTIAGIGVETHEAGFSGTLAKSISDGNKSDVAWKVFAKSGYTAKRVADKLVSRIKLDKVDLIVIGLGGNDAFTLNRPSRWKQNIRDLVNQLRIKYPNAPIVFCNMPPIKDFPAFTPLIRYVIGNHVEILGQALGEVVKEFDNVFYSSERITLSKWIEVLGAGYTKKDFFSDGVHPSELTYQTWAREISKFIFGLKILD